MEKANIQNFDKPMITPEERFKMFEEIAENQNAEVGDLKFVDCPKCKNKGFIYSVNKYNGIISTIAKVCECMKIRKCLYKAEKNGLGQYIDKKMKDFETWNECSELIKNKGVEFCKEHAEDNAWFLIAGQSGCGKTLMCSIICNHLLLNLKKDVLYITWTDLATKIKLQIMSQKANESLDNLEEIKKAEVLFIDEFLKNYTQAELRYLIEIINYRYTNNLKTLITTEYEIIELLNIEESVFGRVFEKCLNGKMVIEIKKDVKKNYRLKELLRID